MAPDEKQMVPMERMFDFDRWPIVVARMQGFSGFSMAEWVRGFDTALDREEPFVLIVDLAAFLADPREDPAEHKQGTIWMKHNRERFTRLCRGNVYVVADEARRQKVLEETSKQGRKLGFPFRAGADLDEAMAIARDLMA